MSTVASPTRYTPEDLLTMPDGNLYELENAQLVERDMSALSSLVAGNVHDLISAYCKKTRKFWRFPEGNSYQCFPYDPNRVRKADVSIVRRDRLSRDQLSRRGHCRVAPDLAVEVLSPNDLVCEVDAKIQLWLNAGVLRVWIVNPEQRTLAIHRADGIGAILRESDEVRDEEVLPGFHCKVGEFFDLKEEPANGK